MIRPTAHPLALPLARGLTRPESAAAAHTPETLEFASRAASLSEAAKDDIDGLVLGLADLGFSWADWAFVPCNSVHGGLTHLGGWATQNAAVAGVAAAGPYGVTMPAWDTTTAPDISGTGSYTDYLLGPRDLTSSARPFTWFAVVSQNGRQYVPPTSSSMPLVVNSNSEWYNPPVRFSINSVSEEVIAMVVDGSANTYPELAQYQVNYHSNAFRATESIWNLYGDGVMLGAKAFDGTATQWVFFHGVDGTKANATTSAWTSPRFTIPYPADSNVTGTIHGLAFYHGDPLDKRPAMKRLPALLGSTVFNYGTRGRFINLHTAGQSNASGPGARMQMHLMGGFRGMVRTTTHQLGGTLIDDSGMSTDSTDGFSYKRGWLDNVTLAANHFFQKGTEQWVQYRPVKNRGRYLNVFVWIQGESDCGTDSVANNYGAKEETLFGHCRTMLDDPECIFIIALINYHVTTRDASTANALNYGSAVANFTLSGLTGATSVLNGTWVCDVLPPDDPAWHLTARGDAVQTNPVDYSWTITGHKLRRQNGRWEFTRNSDNAVLCFSNDNPDHPYMVASWARPLGGTSPAIAFHKTAGIEQMRMIKRDHALSDPKYRFVDMRGCTYSLPAAGEAGVHLTSQGYNELAERISAVVDAL